MPAGTVTFLFTDIEEIPSQLREPLKKFIISVVR
jgi:hypothetical protein